MTATTLPKRLFFIWVTAHYPIVDHAVTDEEMAARNEEWRGEYHGVCGAIFLPAPDDRPPAQCCPMCLRVLRARASMPAVEARLVRSTCRQARHARPGWWSRLRACWIKALWWLC